jgi:hypothetical protein
VIRSPRPPGCGATPLHGVDGPNTGRL